MGTRVDSRLPVLVVIWLLVGHCLSPAPHAHGSQLEQSIVSVEDFRGKTVAIPRPAERIVCLIESALSGLYMLGAESSLVAVSTNVYQEETLSYYAEMDERIRTRSLPTPGSWDFINIESVVALKPDLVIVWAHQKEAIEALEERRIPVFGVFIQSFEDVFREILALGILTGRSDRAVELVHFTREALAELRQKTSVIPPDRRVRVYFMWAQGELETSGRPSTVNELIDLAGATNVCGSLEQEHLVVNMEKVLRWDPQVIIMWHNAKKDPQDILRNPLWQSVNAVRDRRVYEFPDVFSCDLWTLKFQYAAKLVAGWCYPELFAHVDLDLEKRSLFRVLYGERHSF